ncbi:ClpA/ClpB-like protein [Nocardia tenerifensis]|uniref:ClpA/ClpB-like protein n=1 Tax=Nocardia tenerifensis TaxID=228006 RepID=A0A318KA03_9NOCA|nr:Clp protease N-terminal domain-containing protein [Nocardia tenerifensis]PXX52713.1 ClpA/ClpB-like protein [Nocardia tenerifensis]
MFERFTDQARTTVVRAQEEARGRGHDHIGTEHLLLALLSDEQSVGVRALRSLGIEPETIRADIEETVGRADMEASSGHIPFTAGAKQALELSLREAMALGHSYIGAEHILLALLRQTEGVAAAVVLSKGADLPAMRARIRSMSSAAGPTSAPPAPLDSSATARMVIRSLEKENALLRQEVDRLRQFITRRLGAEPPAAAG